jgi:pantothenate kinase
MPLRRIKGRPESYDLPALRRSLGAIRSGEHPLWPRYDRTLHDPVPDAIPVLPEGIVVVEGLYLLLERPGWDRLRADADHGVFLECPEELLRDAVVARKQRQGRTFEDATAHWDLVDHYAWQIISRHRHGVDAVIRLGPERRHEVAAVPTGGPG